MFLGTLITIYVFYLLGDNYEMNENFRLNKTLFSILIILHPLFDLLRTFIIRVSKGLSPFIADQNHIHHWFISKGFSHIKTTFIILLGGTILLILPFWI